MKRIETVAIGDELLTGRISDTNSTYVSNQLFRLGLRLQSISVIPDDLVTIQRTLTVVAKRSDCVICFGGLGPTSDDKTAEAVAALLNTRLVTHEPSRERLEKYYASRNRPVTPQALKQVVFPETSTALLNQAGMAPAFHCRLGETDLFFLPGVPREMRQIFEEFLLPRFQKDSSGVLTRTWRCLGIWESDLQRQMDEIEKALPAGAWLGYRTKFPENHLTLYMGGAHREKNFPVHCEAIRARLTQWTYTEEEKELEELIAEKLLEQGKSLALAESCTGGLVAQRLSRVVGASNWLWGGATVYQNSAKEKLLGVKLNDPSQAVSEGCTRELVSQVKERSGCAIAAAITGYLGPTGGTEKDPVGTIYLAVKGEGWETARMALPVRAREEAQWGASTYLLHLVLRTLRK